MVKHFRIRAWDKKEAKWIILLRRKPGTYQYLYRPEDFVSVKELRKPKFGTVDNVIEMPMRAGLYEVRLK